MPFFRSATASLLCGSDDTRQAATGTAASAGKLDRADTLVKLLACDGDSTDAATEVRALAGAYVERPNYNIGCSILCSPKRSVQYYTVQ